MPASRHILNLSILFIALYILYSPTLYFGFFQIDDPSYIINNPWIHALSFDNIRHILSGPYFANYAPMHIFSYMLDYSIYGMSAWGFHVSQLIWGGLVLAGVYALTYQYFGRWQVAFAAALLFLLHPLHVEVMAWLSSRKDLLATACVLPAMMAYFYYRRKKEHKGWYVLSLALFALAMAGKQSIVIVPLVFLLHDLWVEQRRGWGCLLDKIPYIMLVVVFALPTMGAQPDTRLTASLYVIGNSLAQSLWLLTGLGDYVLYRALPAVDAALWYRLGSMAFPFILLFLLWWVMKRLPGKAVVCFFWLLLALLPPYALNLVHPVSDRYLFFPSVAACMLLAWGMDAGMQKMKTRGQLTFVVLLSCIMLFWGAKTKAYLQQWQDPVVQKQHLHINIHILESIQNHYRNRRFC